MIRLRAFLILALFFFLMSFISASCEEGQIDINSASAEKLDNITHVGPKVAGYIIEKRPFISLDDLDRVPYISSGYVEDIKSQGLACISEQEEESDEENEEVNVNETNTDNNETMADSPVIKNLSSQEETELQTINLNPKVIKSEENSQVSGKRCAIYGLFAFGVLLGLLFLIKNFIRKKYKNEFE